MSATAACIRRLNARLLRRSVDGCGLFTAPYTTLRENGGAWPATALGLRLSEIDGCMVWIHGSCVSIPGPGFAILYIAV